jgi:hypothetical protein
MADEAAAFSGGSTATWSCGIFARALRAPTFSEGQCQSRRFPPPFPTRRVSSDSIDRCGYGFATNKARRQ